MPAEMLNRLAPFVSDPSRESVCKAQLTAFLKKIGQWSIEKNVEELFALDSGVCDRFAYFAPRFPASAFEKLLVSGCAIGSEMIIARNSFNFQEVHGTEVAAEYVQIAKHRLEGQSGFHVVLYDGANLPYENETFTAIVSGHIIEHTPSPDDYLREHMRVLKRGGFFFLEFPNRYHTVELHTNTLSFEWLPLGLRDAALRYMASRYSFANKEKRHFYELVRTTLKPVSVWQIKKYLRSIDAVARVVHHYAPAPGFMRLIVKK